MSQLAIILVLGSTVLHAGWNLLAHSRSHEPMLFACMCMWIAVLGIAPSLAVGVAVGEVLPLNALGYAALSGLCLSVYFLGLTQGYRGGDFTLVYPLARALPILLLVAFDLFRGHTFEVSGYLGLFMVMGGCLFLAANGRSASVPITAGVTSRVGGTVRVSGTTLAWVMVIALGTAGYSSVDKLAMESVAEHHWLLAVQYGCAQFALAWPTLWLALCAIHDRSRRPAGDIEASRPRRGGNGTLWKVALIVAASNFVAYLMVLLAYQLVDHASYVVAMRQFSIVIGAALGAWLLGEPSPRARLAAAAFISLGVASLVVAVAR